MSSGSGAQCSDRSSRASPLSRLDRLGLLGDSRSERHASHLLMFCHSPSGVSSWPRVPAPRSVVSSFADDKLEEGPPTPGDVDGGLAPSGGKPTVASISAPDNFGTERLSTDGGHPHEDSPPSYPGLLSVPSPAMIPKPSSVVLTSEGQQFLLSRYSQDDHRRVV